MIIGIPSEIKTGEQRVAMSPANVQSLTDKGIKVLFKPMPALPLAIPMLSIQRREQLLPDRAEIFAHADIILQVSLSVPTTITVTLT